MEMVESEKYSPYAAAFQFEMIRLLNATLKKQQLPVETRKEICADFAFDISILIDQGEMHDTVPRVIFYQEEEQQLHMGSRTVDFHDYAFGNTDAVFEEEEEAE